MIATTSLFLMPKCVQSLYVQLYLTIYTVYGVLCTYVHLIHIAYVSMLLAIIILKGI